jgi:hypothetical protein
MAGWNRQPASQEWPGYFHSPPGLAWRLLLKTEGPGGGWANNCSFRAVFTLGHVPIVRFLRAGLTQRQIGLKVIS